MYIMRTRIADTFALEALKRSVLVFILMCTRRSHKGFLIFIVWIVNNLSNECTLPKKKKKKRKENETKEFKFFFFFTKQVWTNIEGNRANLVQTAWALLSLIDAGQVVGASFSL
jgi:hypothetical protein